MGSVIKFVLFALSLMLVSVRGTFSVMIFDSNEHCPNPPLEQKFLEMVLRYSTADENFEGISFIESSQSGPFGDKLPHSCGSKLAARFAPLVHIVNASMFLASHQESSKQQKNGTTEAESASTSTEDWCMLVNFYAPHCPFSARLAPNYNALPRAFPSLFIAAIDATQNAKLNLIYGISGTPTLLLFHNGRPVARYDSGGYHIKSLVEFVLKHTDLDIQADITLHDEDYEGPLPSVLDEDVDYYLILAWYFVALCCAYYFCGSSLACRIIDTLKRNWLEMNEE